MRKEKRTKGIKERKKRGETEVNEYYTVHSVNLFIKTMKLYEERIQEKYHKT
jgi:hypothetical protein